MEARFCQRLFFKDFMFFSQRAESLAERGGGGQTADFSLFLWRFRFVYSARRAYARALRSEGFVCFPFSA